MRRKGISKRRKRYRAKPRFYIIIFTAAFLIAAFLMVHFRWNSPAETPYDRGGYIVTASRIYISNRNLVYNDAYFEGGYPPDDVGVCTDVIWKGLRGIGVDLKDLVDMDIRRGRQYYEKIIRDPDPNIDFRRVNVLELYMNRNCQVLDRDPDNYLAWMPGDFVIFESEHIAVVSDITDIWGRHYIIHHGKDPAGEEDRLVAPDGMKISGHFRWTEKGQRR